MVTKKIITPLIIVVILSGIGGVLTAKKITENRLEGARTTADEPSEQFTDISSDQLAAGRYDSYAANKVSEQGYATTVLFFHAGWCPECRSFKQAITSEEIPSGIQILEVNYDTEKSLKKEHGVTLQSTFVKVDSSGKQINKWVGYGKNKSLETILNNL